MKASAMEQDRNFDRSGEALAENRSRARGNFRSAEPIAVVGMACNFPGAPDITSFWRLLESGGNAVSDGLPDAGPDRLEELFKDPANARGACRYCAYVDDIDRFDAGFFRISPVEAELLDPQQRMMLETSWRALEDAGMDPDRLRESLTGVYTGISNDEYRMLVVDSERPGEAAASLYALSGTNLNGASGRVSFALGLMGPAKAVDAACASSLVSVHDAVADLQQGKADLAIAGGVQAILNSRIFELRADSMMLSPDGQCKAFDASANGYVRGEGCGVVVLKRLRDAEADGDRIWGVIRGAAVNHGGASAGLTVPHEPALEQVIETALAQAGVPASEVDYLEAHGTGTPVGDPIEINAVARVYGKGRKPGRPLLVGSVKTNVGHLESAAGIAGLIKAVLVMQRGVIPKHLHFNDPNPGIDWNGLPLQVTSSMMDLPARDGRPRLAGVNSFGISGTNAHIVVEEYPAADTAPYARRRVAGSGRTVAVPLPAATVGAPQRGQAYRERGRAHRERETRLLPLSAKSGPALRELAGRYLAWLDGQADEFPAEGGLPEPLLADTAWTAGVGRRHFDCRAGLIFDNAGQLRERLAALAEAGPGAAPRAAAKVAFAYTGQGSQWAGMGRDLHEREPVARAVFDRCEAVFLEERGASLLDAMFGRAGEGQLSDTAWEQPALYALECALTALWSSVGIRPDAVLGHSAGEIAAAQAAGVFSLEDGMRFACARGTLLSGTGTGAMAAVFAPPGQVAAAVEAANAESAGIGVNISADNGLHQVVSGPAAGVETLAARLASEGIRVRRLNTARAFHSALVEPALDALQASLDRVTVRPPAVTVVSNLTGQAVQDGQLLDGAYWRRHAREPVAFASGARTLADLGVDLILEIGPRAVLAPMAASAWPESAPPPVVLSSIQPAPADSPAGTGSFAEAVAAAYRAGLTIRFEGLFAGETRRRIAVPGYPFQRERYWLRAPKQRRPAEGHPLLGLRRESASGEITYETDIFPSAPGWLDDHRVFERVIAPGALYGAMAASLPQAAAGGQAVVEDMQLRNALVFPEDGCGGDTGATGRKAQLVLGGPGGEDPDRVRILSKGPAEAEWTLHAECRVPSGADAPGAVQRVDLERLKSGLPPVEAAALYKARAATGIDLGPGFRTLGGLWARPGEALGEVSLPEGTGRNPLDIHPLVLDGCFQVVAAARIRGSAEDEATYLPFGWERLWLTAGGLPERVVCHVRMSDTAGAAGAEADDPAEALSGELRIYGPDGVLLGGLDGYAVKRATRAALFSAIEGVDDLLYEVVWRERPLAPAIVAADFLPDPAAIAREVMPLADYLKEEGVGRGGPLPDERPDRGVIVAKGPREVSEPPGAWILVADRNGLAAELANDLAARNQTVMLASDASRRGKKPETTSDGVLTASVDFKRRESWRALLEELPGDVPFHGAAHLAALDGHGAEASARDIEQDVRHAGASALALVQGVADSDLIPEKGVWFITRGAQVLERETQGALAGATLWGFGKAVAREAAHLRPRMIDLDPAVTDSASGLADELMHPDPENHIAWRRGSRRVARLVRSADGPRRLELPEESAWALAPDPAGVFEKPRVKPLPAKPLEAREVRVAVEAAGLNFWDVFRSLGFIEEGNLGREMCGHVVGVGADVANVSVGDRVVGLGFGAFAAEMVTRGELVARAPSGIPVTGLATVPGAFVSAALAYELAGLEAGDRVLIHAGAGGVGLAAVQLAQAAGAEVFATASGPKQAYLRSLGVRHIFDSRQTRFGEDILEATNGAGVTVVLNSLTSEGFIDASLSCLARNGRFVELARRDILSEEEMAAARPDVGYDILELDVLKKTDPAWVGRVLRDVVTRLGAGELKPIVHSRWPLAEAGNALMFMRSARHLGKIVLTTQPLAAGALREDRAYLVTGGLGGIGLAVAGWLANLGAGTIVLNGRRPPGEAAREAIRALEERGATLRVELADVSDAAALDEMLARMDSELPPLAGVIHSVGALSDGALTNQNWDRFETVLWPKVLGAWRLHRATADRDLDLFILFSSRVGVMGNPGQANHAAANAFLDQLAGHRRALGLPGQAIAWGAWSEIGEAAEQKDRIERHRSALGGRWFTPRQGIRALDRLVRQDVTASVVMAMDWPVFEEAVEDRPAFLEELLSPAAEEEADGAASPEDLLTQLANANAPERKDLLVSFLQQQLQAVLRLPSAPAPTAGFFGLGMDSLMAVEFRNRLNRALAGACAVSNTVVFDYPDIKVLARHLDGELGDIDPAPAPQAAPARQLQPTPQELPVSQAQPLPERRPATRRGEDRIAIVGMACRFPGAPDLSAFWRLLEAGADLVTDGRRDPGPWSGIVGDPSAEDPSCRRGGFVEEIDRFDARFFGIPPIEARMMDPRQRMLLETSWHALEDAGIDPGPLRGSRAGVFAGLGGSEYRDLIAAAGKDDSYLGTAASVAIGRVAFALGLMGPAIPLDMTCASSLVAVHQAAASLRQGEVDLALAGGAHVILSPPVMRFMREYGMLSRTGRCRTFDAAADGFVRGEGCGMAVLKRLNDAEADGDRIWGVVRGSAVNQNGAAAALTVPNGTAQERLFAETLSNAGLAPSDVDYLEAHGTGSELGDPIEVRAAAAVYGRGRDAERPILLGTVKTNIGHLESAAGVAGLIKVLLSMHRGVIPGQLHFESPNPHVEWDRLPVRVASEPTAWPTAPDRPPTAGISAFGISGTNAHLLVEGCVAPDEDAGGNGAWLPAAGSPRRVPTQLPEPPGDRQPPGSEPGSRGTRLLPLSGKSEQALKDLAERYLSWLDEREEAIASDGDAASSLLADMAWTASMGRSHFEHRAGVVFDNAASLREGLMNLVREGGAPGPHSTEKPGLETIVEAGPEAAGAQAAARAYEAGDEPGFQRLFAGEARRRISLPGYPFQRRPFWFDSPRKPAP